MKYFKDLNAQDQERVIMRAMANNKPTGILRATVYDHIREGWFKCAVLKIYWDEHKRLLCDVVWDNNRQVSCGHFVDGIKYHDDVIPEPTPEQYKANYEAVYNLLNSSTIYMFDDKLRLIINIKEEDNV